MARLALVTTWLLAGGAIAGGVYWAFLNTPESTVGTLALSAMLALGSLTLLAITINGALILWANGWSRRAPGAALASVPAFLPALTIALVVWWIAGRATGWVTSNSGEINAWFIARFGWADASPFFTGVTWVGRWLRWVVGPVAACSLLGALLDQGWRSITDVAWLRRVLSPIRVGLSTMWFGVLVAAPWFFLVPWRPRGIPATTVELAFIATKLSVAAATMAIGTALVLKPFAPPPTELR